LRDFTRFRGELLKLRSGETSALHAAEPRTRLDDAALDSAQALIETLRARAGAARNSRAARPQDFAELAERHRDVLTALSRDEQGAALVFEGSQGSVLAAGFDDLLGPKTPSGLMVELGDYPDVFPDRVRRPRGATAGGGETFI